MIPIVRAFEVRLPKMLNTLSVGGPGQKRRGPMVVELSNVVAESSTTRGWQCFSRRFTYTGGHMMTTVDLEALSDGQVATMTGVSRRAVCGWHKLTPPIPANPDGTHRAADVIAWHVERCRGKATATGDRHAEEIKLMRSRRRLLDMKFRRERGELIDLAEVIQASAEAVTIAKIRLTSSIEPIVLAAPPELRATYRGALEREMNKALLDLRDGFAKVAPNAAPAPAADQPGAAQAERESE